MAQGRVRCCVPFCKRTTTARRAADIVEWPDDLWICSKHWRDVPLKFKQVKRRARRALRKNAEAVARFARVSRRCTRAAMDAAMGLS